MTLSRYSGMFLVVARVWTALILIGCWLPGNTLPEPESASFGFHVPNVDKLIHACMFLGFGGLWMLAGRPDMRRVIWVGGFGLLLAVATEAGQSLPFVHRDAGIADALADCVGLALGIVSALAVAGRPDRAIASRADAPDNQPETV